jgi:NAD-dependent deacetylase
VNWCPDCGSYLRPDVVWFDESLPAEALERSLRAANNCEIFISILTSTLVEPAASLPFRAKRNGATVLEINPQSTLLTPLTSYSVRGNSGEIIPKLVLELLN